MEAKGWHCTTCGETEVPCACDRAQYGDGPRPGKLPGGDDYEPSRFEMLESAWYLFRISLSDLIAALGNYVAKH